MRRLLLLVAATLACAAPAPEVRAGGWRILGPGGGGSLYHPTISPHDSRIALVACDMTGAYLTRDGGATWRMFNLGEPVRAFLFDPLDANVIYALTQGAFRSDDGGTTWKRFFPRTAQVGLGDDHASGDLIAAGHPIAPITALAIDPADSRSLYLAQGPALSYTADGGAAWRKSADLPGPAHQIWIDPHSPKDRPHSVRRRSRRVVHSSRGKVAKRAACRSHHVDCRHAPDLLCHHRRQDSYLDRRRRQLARFRLSRDFKAKPPQSPPTRTIRRSPTCPTADCARPCVRLGA